MASRTLLVALALLAASAPALAYRNRPTPPPPPPPAPTPVPEPGDAGLLLLGVIGVATGRWVHARRARAQRTAQ